jgi:acyl-coenzyme A synthetase/AMP-(fatty) acid ligase
MYWSNFTWPDFHVPTPPDFINLCNLKGKQALMDWLAERVGRTQRLADLVLIDELPRNAIGKVDKVRLRALYAQAQAAASSV